MEPILDIRDLCVTYHSGNRNVKAVDGVSLTIDEGDSLGIVGESGSGKSTMAMALLRMLDPRYTDVTGQALYGDEDLLTVNAARLSALRWKEIAVVFQKSMNSLSPVHRIGEQFEDIYRVHEPKADKKFIRAHVEKLFAMVNLAPRVYDLYPHELSGGMLQRTSIAMALMFHPRILVMDEATTALDVVTQGQILQEIRKLEAEHFRHSADDYPRPVRGGDLLQKGDRAVCRPFDGVYGNVREVLSHPAHPYTEGLIASFPSLHGKKEELKSSRASCPTWQTRPRAASLRPAAPMRRSAAVRSVRRRIRWARGMCQPVSAAKEVSSMAEKRTAKCR